MQENRFVKIDPEKYPNKVKLPSRLSREYRRSIKICNICRLNCHIPPGYTGICGNIANIDGKLYDIGYGLLSAIESRPIEIKPLYHFHPNSTALTFSGWGCNYHCLWCQNYCLSMRKPPPPNNYISPEKLVKIALKRHDDGLCASFNEPIIHTSYLIDVFKIGRSKGLYNIMVSNGYLTMDAMKLLIESGLDGLNIDIKGCPEAHKHVLKAVKPDAIFKNAEYLIKNGIHLEMVFLIVPGFNDDPECIEWVIKEHYNRLGVDIPLHINRYYPAYKYYKPSTSIRKLLYAYETAKKYGLKYVYIGNIWNKKYETTYCPKCGCPLIIRDGYRVIESRLDGDRCRRCGEKIYLTGYIHK